MFNMTALRTTLKKAEKRKINAPEKLQFKMICWNLGKRDLSGLISENLQSTSSCQQYFLISWNLINGLLLSTGFEQESSARSQTFAKLNIYISFFRKCSFNKRIETISESVRWNSRPHKNFAFHFIMVNSLQLLQTNTPSYVYPFTDLLLKFLHYTLRYVKYSI